MKGLTDYMAMIMDPFRSTEHATRYPDETIVPTGLTSLQESRTFTSTSQVANWVTALKWKVNTDAGETPGFSENPITPMTVSDGTTLPLTNGVPYSQQSQWQNLSSIDRTLAMGIKVTSVGLPSATFMATGSVYFIQYQNNELASLLPGLGTANGEAIARSAVAAKKGFMCSMNEISKSSGVAVTYLPQGPMSFVFSDTGSVAATNAGVKVQGGASSTVVSANGGVLVAFFGLSAGTILRIDYGHIVEYVPTTAAAGLIQTEICPPSSSLRDSISAGAAQIQTHVTGATSLGAIANVVAGGALTAATSVARSVLSGIPGGAALAQGATAIARSMNAPQWLSGALAALTG